MAAKQDHLRLCNDKGMSFQEFTANWCSNCRQPECTRSLHGKSRFDQRIGSWEERLFTHIQQLDPSDPRFKEIVGKKFLPIAPGNTAQPSSWLDPREVETTKAISIPTPAAVAPPPPAPPPPPPPDPVPEPKVEASPSVRTPEPSPPPTPALSNTPNKPRQMLVGKEAPAPLPVSDPWRPVQPLKPGETLVKPGARIKFGS